MNEESVVLYACGILEVDGEPCRARLDERKSRLRKLLRTKTGGVLDMETDGQLVFEHACQFGCDGSWQSVLTASIALVGR